MTSTLERKENPKKLALEILNRKAPPDGISPATYSHATGILNTLIETEMRKQSDSYNRTSQRKTQEKSTGRNFAS